MDNLLIMIYHPRTIGKSRWFNYWKQFLYLTEKTFIIRSPLWYMKITNESSNRDSKRECTLPTEGNNGSNTSQANIWDQGKIWENYVCPEYWFIIND